MSNRHFSLKNLMIMLSILCGFGILFGIGLATTYTGFNFRDGIDSRYWQAIPNGLVVAAILLAIIAIGYITFLILFPKRVR